jgi:hypothetical protein
LKCKIKIITSTTSPNSMIKCSYHIYGIEITCTHHISLLSGIDAPYAKN